MPQCPKCLANISDNGWKLHQFVCPGKSPSVATPPLTVITPETPANNNSPIPLTVPVEVVSHDTESIVTPLIPEQHAVSTTGSNGSEVFYPSIDPYFMVNEDTRELLRALDQQSHKHPTNCLITGQPGGGKTSLGLQFAAINHRPAVVADFGVVQEPQQLFQTTRLIESNGNVITDTRESGFVRGIETANCVVIMDELTRVENERCLNPLMPILDGRRESWIDDLRRRIHVADGVIFIATINEGSMFCGISSLDAALRDRFVEVYMDYLPAEQEATVIANKAGVPGLIAATLADFAGVVRRTPAVNRKVSTRQLLHAAEMYACGTPLWLALTAALGNYNDPSWRQQCLEIFSLNIKDETELVKWQSKSEGEYVLYQ